MQQIEQSNSELGQETSLTIPFKTANKIPQGSTMVVTLPSNLIMSPAEIAMKVNGESVTPVVNEIAFQLKTTVPL